MQNEQGFLRGNFLCLEQKKPRAPTSRIFHYVLEIIIRVVCVYKKEIKKGWRELGKWSLLEMNKNE